MPFSILDRISARRFGSMAAPRLGRQAPYQLDPEEEEDLVKSIGQKTLGAVSGAGAALDWDSSAVRNILAGKNPIPGLISPFSHENRVTGRGLLETRGLAPRNRPGFHPIRNPVDALFDVAGFATEIALDPKTYLTLGASALGKAGQLAKRAGLLDDLGLKATQAARAAGGTERIGNRVARMRMTLDDALGAIPEAAKRREAAQSLRAQAQQQGLNLDSLMQQPLGGLAGYGMPFMSPRGVLGKAGGAAEKVAARMDRVGEALRFGNIPGTNISPGRRLASVLSAKTKGFTETEVQRHAPALHKAEAANRVRANQLTEEVLATQKRLGMTDEAGDRMLRSLYESNNVDDLNVRIEQIKNRYGATDQEVVDLFRHTSELGRQLHKERSWGLHGQPLDDAYAAYFPRSMARVSKKGSILGEEDLVDRLDPSGARSLGAGTESQKQRRAVLTGIKGSTDTIITMAKDPGLRRLMDDAGGTPQQVAEYIRDTWGDRGSGLVPPTYQAGSKHVVNDAGEVIEEAVQKNRYLGLAETLGRIEPEVRELGVYGNATMADYGKRILHGDDAIESVKTVFKVLLEPKVLESGTDALRHPDTKKLTAVLEDLHIRAGDTEGGALKRLAEMMGQAPTPEYLAQLGKMHVDKRVARDLAHIRKPFTSPHEVGAFVRFYDSLSNVFKAMVTGPFPAFVNRNLGSGQFRNFTAGMFSPWSVQAAYRIVRGEEVSSGVLAKLKKIPHIQQEAARMGLAMDDAGVRETVSRLARRHGVIGRFQGEMAQRTGTAGESLTTTVADELKGFPGHEPFQFGRAAKKYFGKHPGTSWNPMKIRGAFGNTESAFGPVAGGEELNYLVESLNRLSPWLDELAKGSDPLTAKLKVGAAQVDYAAREFTPMEREWAARLFPFWKFSSRQVPYVLKELIESPGGKTAAVIRGTNRARDSSGILPEYVSESTSVPIPEGTPGIGPKAGGDPRYLTGLGLMHEDPLKFLSSDYQKVGLEALARMNPLAKMPLEMATGQSFFQKGRPLEDLDPLLGRIGANVFRRGQDRPDAYRLPQWLEVLAANSPAARLLTTVKTATDPRKALGDSGLKGLIPGPAAAMNLLTGMRFSDVSPGAQDAILREATKDVIKGTPGSRVFERVFFSKADLAKMGPEEQRRALQLQAVMGMLAERAKERAKEQAKGL